jgi:hypothetical protein
MQKTPPQVFLDANVVIRCGKPPGAPMMPRIADLVAGGHVRIVTTDLTKTEVAKKHAGNDLEELGVLAKRRFRDLAKRSLGVEIPEITADALHHKLLDSYTADVERMFARLSAETVSIDSIQARKVFDSYALQW